ncbi:spore coat protein U domain-containing protein [Ramlibacter aquaticus]|uniref:Spore coat protein U domain-containing protein n=1 Tax=Ramlibacter aquaticus TaxID=2780094 RepID=A0ABR9SBH7_9BURK|nr:spore coat protein U domain-containing protein [Ramlibacter aquaticus]MBE7939696.1 spore coat protein U domain-containing protein [Ramlibacter aquaticus]
MTTFPIQKLALALVLACAAGAALADTQSLSVTASITGVCKFNSGQTPVLAFGAIDPSGTANATASASVLYRCTTGTSASVSNAVTGARTLQGSGTASTDTMAYTLAFTSGGTGTGKGFGAGQDLTLVLGGTITPTDYQNKTVGPYADTVTLTVTP